MSDIRVCTYCGLRHGGTCPFVADSDRRMGKTLAMSNAIERDTAHAVALERERIAKLVADRGTQAQANIFAGNNVAYRMWDLADDIRNGKHHQGDE